MFHAHLIAREAYTKLIRNGKEISYLFKNKHYDPFYQYYTFFQNRTTIQKVKKIDIFIFTGRPENIPRGHLSPKLFPRIWSRVFFSRPNLM